jgi:hypothetical protein
MKHALMNPAFPDMVKEWAAEEPAAAPSPCNDDFDDRVADYLANLQNERLIAAIRCW